MRDSVWRTTTLLDVDHDFTISRFRVSLSALHYPLLLIRRSLIITPFLASERVFPRVSPRGV